MKITNELIREAIRLDEQIIKDCSPEDVPFLINEDIPQDHRALLWLQADLGTIATDVTEEKFDDIINRYIEASPMAKYIKDAVNIPKIKKLAAIRKNWKQALDAVDKGRTLSSYIDWSFSDKDLAILAKLHSEGDDKIRTKIEDLLEDCNFHSENGDFETGKYDRYLKALPDEYEEDTDIEFLNEENKIRDLMYRLDVTREEAKELYDNSVDDRDNEWSFIYDNVEEYGRSEFESLVPDNWIERYFDFKSFGEDLVESGDRPLYVLSSGKVVLR